MITYKEYLLNMIAESTMDSDTADALTESVLESEDISELDTIEERIVEAAKGDDLTLKEQQDSSGANAAPDNGKNQYQFTKKDIEQLDKISEKYERGIEMLQKGDIRNGSKVCAEVCKDAAAILGRIAKKCKGADETFATIAEFSDMVLELDKEAKRGDITASKATTLGKKILAKIKTAENNLKTLVSKQKPTATKESALNAVFEAASDGYLNDDDLEFLADVLSD